MMVQSRISQITRLMIELQDICRTFQVGDESVHALDQVSLEIAHGDYISVMGPSGSGKSTLLNMLGLLDSPDSGSYQFKDQELTRLSEEKRARFRRENIGFIFQSFHLIPRLTAAGNLELPLMLTGMAPAKRRVLVAEALEAVGLEDRARHLPKQLSGGQQQRVAIARATIMKPPLLLADEPTGNLDTHSGKEVVKTLEALNASGIILIIVTHDLELGARARRRIHMVDGRVVDDETA